MLDCLENTERFSVQGTCAQCYGLGKLRRYVTRCPSCGQEYDRTRFSFLLTSTLPCGHDPAQLQPTIAERDCSKCHGTGHINRFVQLPEIIRAWGERLSLIEHHQE